MDSETSRDRCRYFESLFSPYIDGALDGPERKALAQHLHDCEQCAERFGASWREATAKAVGGPRRGRMPRGRRTGLWLLSIGCLAGVVVLGAMGLLEAGEGGPDPFRLRSRTLVGEEIGRMITVQTELLKAVVGPLRGSEEHVSHAERGAALDFFERLALLAKGPAPRTGGEQLSSAQRALESCFHSHFRAADPEPGGRDWDRVEFLDQVARSGLPRVVLVRVHAAFKEVLLCSVAWGERPAFAWLLRERIAATPAVEAAAPSDAGAFRIAYLLFSRP